MAGYIGGIMVPRRGVVVDELVVVFVVRIADVVRLVVEDKVDVLVVERGVVRCSIVGRGVVGRGDVG